jgi:deoxyribonuclease-4
MVKVGCHISSAGGIYKVFERAKNVGAECIQTFAGSPQVWKFPNYSDEDIAKFKVESAKYNIGPVFFHSIYLINLASENNAIRHGAINSLIKTWQLAEQLGIAGVITHTGSDNGRGFEVALPMVKHSLEQIMTEIPKEAKSKLFLEIAAGAGGIIGDSIKELGDIIKSVDSDERIGFALDTCHAFVSGYDLRVDEGINRLASEIESEIGWERLGAIHLNDSKGDLGSKKDRHEVVGQGYLGIETFNNLLHHRKFSQYPLILETPDIKSDVRDVPESLLIVKGMV